MEDNVPEEILDTGTRNAILGRLAGLSKKAKEPEPIREIAVAPKEKVVEKTVCVGCGHKIWNDGDDWCHSGMSHDENCECREAKAKAGAVKESGTPKKKKVFDSTTSFDELLEACAESHNAVKAEDEEAVKVADDTRQIIIEKISEKTSILNGWRF